MRILATYRAHLDGVADSVTFECDGTSSMCADGTLTWSCSEQCTSPGGSCSMVLSGAGLRGTIPAALGDVRCAPWITKLCVPLSRVPCRSRPPAGPLTAAFSGSLLNNNALSGDVPASAGNFRSLKEL
jgi:hypothetical protein